MAENCIFCKIAAGDIPSTTIYEDDEFKAFFDVSPATKGHCLVVPKAHYANIFELDGEVAGRLFTLVTKLANAMKQELNCDGMNIMQNNGEIAGQTVFHFHMHLIPRYENDGIKFGYAAGEADMEALSELAKKLQSHL